MQSTSRCGTRLRPKRQRSRLARSFDVQRPGTDPRDRARYEARRRTTTRPVAMPIAAAASNENGKSTNPTIAAAALTQFVSQGPSKRSAQGGDCGVRTTPKAKSATGDKATRTRMSRPRVRANTPNSAPARPSAKTGSQPSKASTPPVVPDGCQQFVQMLHAFSSMHSDSGPRRQAAATGLGDACVSDARRRRSRRGARPVPSSSSTKRRRRRARQARKRRLGHRRLWVGPTA